MSNVGPLRVGLEDEDLVIAGACLVLGLVVGSLLSVLIWRVPRGEPIIRPAHCPDCGHRIRFRDGVPVLGWVLLRGRCRDCGSSISWRYPGVEVVTGSLFMVVGWRFGASWELPAYLYLVAVGVALSWIDVDTRRLPDVLILPSYPVLGLLFLLPAAVCGQWSDYVRAGVGGAALFGGFLVAVLVHPVGMGFGDVKLAGLLGIGLGWQGWGVLVAGVFLGYLLAALVGVVMLVTRRAGWGSAVAFGPFMVAGALVALVVGASQ